MIRVSPRTYAMTLWQLLSEAPDKRSKTMARVAEDLVTHYRRPFRERVLQALAGFEEAAQARPPIKVVSAREGVEKAVQKLFPNTTLDVQVDPSLQGGFIFERGQWRVDVSLKRRLKSLKRTLMYN